MILYDNTNEITLEMPIDQYSTIFEHTGFPAHAPYVLHSGNADEVISYNNMVRVMCERDPIYSEQYQSVLLKSVHFDKGNDVAKITLQTQESNIKGIEESARHCGFKFKVKEQENS